MHVLKKNPGVAEVPHTQHPSRLRQAPE